MIKELLGQGQFMAGKRDLHLRLFSMVKKKGVHVAMDMENNVTSVYFPQAKSRGEDGEFLFKLWGSQDVNLEMASGKLV